MDYLKRAKENLEGVTDMIDAGNARDPNTWAQMAQAAALIAIAEQLKNLNENIDLLRQAVEVLHPAEAADFDDGEPINHPADVAERVSGCGEDVAYTSSRCPLCQLPWAQCRCGR